MINTILVQALQFYAEPSNYEALRICGESLLDAQYLTPEVVADSGKRAREALEYVRREWPDQWPIPTEPGPDPIMNQNSDLWEFTEEDNN